MPRSRLLLQPPTSTTIYDRNVRFSADAVIAFPILVSIAHVISEARTLSRAASTHQQAAPRPHFEGLDRGIHAAYNYYIIIRLMPTRHFDIFASRLRAFPALTSTPLPAL